MGDMRAHRPTRPTRLGVLIAAVACLLALAGCGDGDEGGTSAEPSDRTPSSTAPASTPASDAAAPTPSKKPVQLPSCERLWVVGKVLPASYRGCVDKFGQVSKSLRGCVNRKLAQHGDQLYAIVGREIVRATPDREHNADYMALLEACSG